MLAEIDQEVQKLMEIHLFLTLDILNPSEEKYLNADPDTILRYMTQHVLSKLIVSY